MPANTSFLFEQKSFTSGSVYQISIKNGVIFYNESITGFNKSWEEKISPEQTKELYQLFLDNKFDLMKFTPSENHSVSEAYIIIRLVIDSKTIVEIKNTGIEIASAEDKAGFNQIAAKMQKLAKSSN